MTHPKGARLGEQRATSAATHRAASKLVDAPMSHTEVVRAMTGGSPVSLVRRVELARLNLEQARQLYYERHQQYLDALSDAGEVPQ